MSEETAIESGASAEGSVTPESSSPVETQETATPEVEAPKTPEVPFHEHPRFKELVEQKNTFADQLKAATAAQQALQHELAQIRESQKQASAPKPPNYDPLLKQLEQVNPEFASLMKAQMEKAKSVEVLEQRLAQQEQFYQSYQQQQALSQFDKLCTDNNVNPLFKEAYGDIVANIANVRGAQLSELPKIFKEVHDRLSKSLGEYERSVTAKYVTQKTGDTKPVAKPGGAPATPGGKQAPMTAEDAKKELAAAIRAMRSA